MKSLASLWIMNERNHEVFAIKKYNRMKISQQLVYLEKNALYRYRHGKMWTTERFNAEMRRCVFFFPARLYHAQHGTGAYLASQDAARPVRSSDRRATQPETGSATFWPAAHEQWDRERFLGGREHDRTTRCFIDNGDRKYSFLRVETYELKLHVQLHKQCLEHPVAISCIV